MAAAGGDMLGLCSLAVKMPAQHPKNTLVTLQLPHHHAVYKINHRYVRSSLQIDAEQDATQNSRHGCLALTSRKVCDCWASPTPSCRHLTS